MTFHPASLVQVRLVMLGSMLLLSEGAVAKEKEEEDEGIQMTGIEAFDTVFSRVEVIDGKLAASEGHVVAGRTSLNTALELPRGTPIADGLGELQDRAGDKLTVAVNTRQIPTLTATEAVPSNVQDAVDAVNEMTAEFSSALTELEALVPEIQGLVTETSKMPGRLKDEFTGGFLATLFALPKTAKVLTHDIEVTKGLADRSTGLTTSMTDVLGAVQGEFRGGGGGGTARQPGPSPSPRPSAPRPAPAPEPKPSAPKTEPGSYIPPRP